MSDLTLGFVGLGKMGGPLCNRLLAAGHRPLVFDVNEATLADFAKRGAQRAASVKAMADAADIIFTSLPMPDIVERVALGTDGVASGSKARVLVDLSTTGQGTAKRVAEGLSRAGKQWVDCPVSGGVRGAVNGTLALMVSCPKPTFELVQPLLVNFGKVFFVGEKPGLGQVAKLGNNMMSAVALVCTAEAMAMAVKAGIDPDVMIDIINAGSGRNSASQDKFPKSVLTGKFDFGFATGLFHKDVRLCVDESEAMGVPMLMGSLARQILTIANTKYGPDSDFTSMVRVVEDMAGVEIRSVKKT